MNHNTLFKKRLIAIIVILAALAAGVGIYTGIYNSPQKHLERLLELGNTYLTEERYEEAVVIFEQAIAIDPKCIEAYAGGMEAYLNTDDVEKTEAFYEMALEAVDGLEEESLVSNMDIVVSIYLCADTIYSEEPEKAIEVLERGIDVTAYHTEVKENLVNDYLTITETYYENGAYEDSLPVYDRLLELDRENVQDDMETFLQTYLSMLLEEDEYDTIKELDNKYTDIMSKVKEEIIEDYISNAQEYAEDGAYEEALILFDKLRELESNSETLQEAMNSFLQEYMNLLINEKQYDEVRRLAEKYTDMDFEALLKEMEEQEQLEARLEEERLAKEAEEARLAAQAASTDETPSANGAKYRDEDIPLFIKAGEIKVPYGAWTEEQRIEYRKMWYQYWGWNPPW